MAAREQALAAATTRAGAPARPNRAHWVFWGALAALLAIAFGHEAYLFSTAIHEQGDEALNSLLVARAEHFEQLVGNYSRVGFHHPGPALFYVLAAGQAFFHGLHIVPAPYNGELLGASVYTAVLLSLAVLAIYRMTRSAGAAALACGAFVLFAAQQHMFGDVWFPYLYMAPFLLLMVAGAALAAGHTVELPSFVLAAGLLAHGHVSFLMFVGVTVVAVAACWWRRHRARWHAELRAHRRGWVGALVLVGLFLLPVLVELGLHWPGPWRGYLSYVGRGDNQPRTAGDVAGFTGWYWLHGVPLWITVVALVAGVALTVRARQRNFVCLYGMLALQTVLFVFYVARGVDVLDGVNRYVGFFYLTVPLLLAVTAGCQLLLALPDRWPPLVPALVPAFALLVSAAVIAQPRDKYLHGTDYPALAGALAAAPARDGRVVALDFAPDLWPQAAGAGVAAQRAGVPWCVSNPRWRNLFTAPYICAAGRAQWTLALWPADSVPTGTVVVWHDANLAVVERDPSAALLPAHAR